MNFLTFLFCCCDSITELAFTFTNVTHTINIENNIKHYSETFQELKQLFTSHNHLLSPYTIMSSYSSTSSHLSSRSSDGNNSLIFENTMDKQEPASSSTTNMSTSNNVAVDYSLTSPIHSRRTTNHSAVVQAMITSNNLRNCQEVQEMVSQCTNNKDNESFVCKTALRYHGGCKN